MSLTAQDLSQIRDVMLEALDGTVIPRLDRLVESMARLAGVELKLQHSTVTPVDELNERYFPIETSLRQR